MNVATLNPGEAASPGGMEREFAPVGAARAKNHLGLALVGVMALGLGASAWNMLTEPGGTVAAVAVGALALGVAGMVVVARPRARIVCVGAPVEGENRGWCLPLVDTPRPPAAPSRPLLERPISTDVQRAPADLGVALK